MVQLGWGHGVIAFPIVLRRMRELGREGLKVHRRDAEGVNQIIHPTHLLEPNQPISQPSLIQPYPVQNSLDKQGHNNGNPSQKGTLLKVRIFMPTGYLSKAIQ